MLLLQYPPALRRLADLDNQRLAARIGVQEASLSGPAKQRLMGMLRMYVHQQLPEISAVSERRRGAVDVGSRAPLCGYGPAQYALARRVEVPLCEPHAGAGVLTHVKARRNVGARRAGSNCLRVRAITDAQTQGVEHDGFSGAGFTGDGGHPRVQVDLQPVDYGIALNRKVKEHSVHISLLSGCYSAGRRRCEHLMRAACATMSDALSGRRKRGGFPSVYAC